MFLLSVLYTCIIPTSALWRIFSETVQDLFIHKFCTSLASVMPRNVINECSKVKVKQRLIVNSVKRRCSRIALGELRLDEFQSISLWLQDCRSQTVFWLFNSIELFVISHAIIMLNYFCIDFLKMTLRLWAIRSFIYL